MSELDSFSILLLNIKKGIALLWRGTSQFLLGRPIFREYISNRLYDVFEIEEDWRKQDENWHNCQHPQSRELIAFTV